MAMINCPNCGHIISDKARVCPQCKIETYQEKCCPECGNAISGTGSSCPSCGYPLQEKSEAEKPKMEKESLTQQNATTLKEIQNLIASEVGFAWEDLKYYPIYKMVTPAYEEFEEGEQFLSYDFETQVPLTINVAINTLIILTNKKIIKVRRRFAINRVETFQYSDVTLYQEKRDIFGNIVVNFDLKREAFKRKGEETSNWYQTFVKNIEEKSIQ